MTTVDTSPFDERFAEQALLEWLEELGYEIAHDPELIPSERYYTEISVEVAACSTNRHKAFAMRIWSIVRHSISSNRGLATT